MLSVVLAGCKFPQNGQVEPKPNEGGDPYSQELAKIMPSSEMKTLFYYGLAEYGHISTFGEIIESDEELVYIYNGVMDDGAGGDDRTFIAKYTITDNEIIETIELNDYLRSNTKTLNSLIPGKIVLQLPLVAGNKWSYKATFEGEDIERVVTTTITKVEYLPESKLNVYSTVTEVQGVEGYADGKYIEKRIYIEGYGLILFENSIPNYINADGEVEEMPFMFGYGLSGYAKEVYGEDGNLKFISIYDVLKDYYER